MSHKARQRAADRKAAKQRKKIQNVGQQPTGLCLVLAVLMLAVPTALAVVATVTL